MSIKRSIGEAYVKYKIRVGRGASFTNEIEGLKNAFTSGGVIIILVKTYTNVLLPLWVLPVVWALQKLTEYALGWYDEKKLGWWKFENHYMQSNPEINPVQHEILETLRDLKNRK